MEEQGDSKQKVEQKEEVLVNSEPGEDVKKEVKSEPKDDLLTNVETQSSTTLNQVEVTIDKNTTYKWWVLSKSTETIETAKSDEWKFYNSGDTVKTHAPFPAELVITLPIHWA